MKNKWMIALIIMTLVVGEMPATVYAMDFHSYQSGSQVEKQEAENYKTIEIQTEEDLKKLANSCNLDSFSRDKKVVLKNNIELQKYRNLMIPSFAGIFEGNGHKISNLKLTAEGSSIGLFRYIQKNGEVRNLNLEAEIMPEGTRCNVGAIAGVNYGLIFHCSFTGTIKGDNRIGGLVGVNEAEGTIRSSVNHGIIVGNHSTGGIAGENAGVIDYCSNFGDINIYSQEVTYDLTDIHLDGLEQLRSTEKVEAHMDSGGIVGLCTGKIYYSQNAGSVGYSHVGYNTGGIAGRLKQGYIQNCSNKGKIYGRKDVGGIAGQMEPFVEIEYFVDKLQKLDGEVGRLFDLIHSSQENFHNISKQVTNVSKTITGYLKEIQNAQNALSNAGVELWNAYNNELNLMGEDIRNRQEKWENEKLELEIPEKSDKEESTPEEPNSEESNSEQGKPEDTETGKPGDTETGKPGETEGDPTLQDRDDNGVDADQIHEGLNLNSSDSSNVSGNGTDSNADQSSNREINVKNDLVTDVPSAVFLTERKLPDFIENPYKDMKDEITDIGNQTITHLDNLKDAKGESESAIQNSIDSINQSMSLAGGSIEQLISIFQDGGDSTSQDVQAIVKQAESIQTVMNQIRNDLFQYEGLTVEDSSLQDEFHGLNNPGIKDGDLLNQTENQIDTNSFQLGKITLCENEGVVEADTNVGGIVGQVATEYDFDPEDDISSKGQKSLNVEKSMKAVIRESRNRGDVLAKKDYVGGIVGRAEHGALLYCESYGDVQTKNGNYVGGIAGMHKNVIQSCYSMGTCIGKCYVGGIVGRGNHIYACYAYNNIDAEGEGVGAIAGIMEEDGALLDNYYVEGSLAGIDGVSYLDGAEPLSYQEFAKRKEVPPSFSDFTIQFVLDGKEIASYKRSYGEAITKNQIPSIPQKEGYYARWPEYDYDHITGNKVLEAQYEKWISTLESKEKEKNRAKILIEGQFYPDMKLEILKEENNSYQITIENSETGEKYEKGIEVHYQCEEPERQKVLVENAGVWSIVDSTVKGNYLIFPMDAPGHFQVTEESSPIIRFIIMAGSALAVLILLFLIILRFKKKKLLFQRINKKAVEKKNSKDEQI